MATTALEPDRLSKKQDQPPAATVQDRRADAVARHSPAFRRQAWRKVKRAQQTGGPQLWEVQAAPVWLDQDPSWSLRTYGLLGARHVATGEGKYFLSNAPANAKLAALIRGAFHRGKAEPCIRVAKTLGLLGRTFVAGHTKRLSENGFRTPASRRNRGSGPVLG